MGTLIVLKLDGDLNQGLRVTLEIGTDDQRPEIEVTGKLPPAAELAAQYHDWQSTYRSLGKATRLIKAKRAWIDGSSLKQQKQECRNQAWKLRDSLNDWLRADSFALIREKWLEKVSTAEAARVLIRTEDSQLWQLPWHQWDLIERYSLAEIGLSKLEYERLPKSQIPPHRDQLKILAILGNSQGIHVENDQQQLESLPKAAVTFLVEPQRQALNDQLWQQPWDILFFAGHSQTEGAKGRIHLNPTDSLTLDELKYALKKAISGGLQLAIFNSCDGLGLAQELEPLHIPQMIVMREPVPDQVAQAFLQYFLPTFASGKPFYLAVQEARQRLQGLEDEFPCASWLPAICQNPAAVPLSWPQLPEPASQPVPGDRFSKLRWRPWQAVLATSLAITGLLIGVRSFGVLQPWELESYDQLLRQRPAEAADPRLLVVGLDEADIRQYRHPLSDTLLAQVIQKLEPHQPAAIGLDIFRDQPEPPGYASLVTQLRQPNLVSVCTFGTSPSNAVAPPPASPAQQVSFNDLEADSQDNTVRRQLMSRSPNAISVRSPCKTPYSFSLQLSYQYFETRNIPASTTPDQNWQFDRVVFQRLQPRSNGYQHLDARGNQMMINYRATPQIAQQVTIKEVLTGTFEPEWVKNRVVLIGVTAASIQDHHNTPYGRMRGVEVHAHTISQSLSAVLDGRPLIWWLPLWGDALWIWGWSLIGGILAWRLRSHRAGKGLLYLVLAMGFCVAILYGLCWALLLQGGWLPLVPAAVALVITAAAIAIIPLPTQQQACLSTPHPLEH